MVKCFQYFNLLCRIDLETFVRILAIGDVTSHKGIDHLYKNLWRIRREEKIDLCIVNGENASFITGISEMLADKLFQSGADVITGGNHTLNNRSIYTYLDDTEAILRPLNYGADAPGKGYTVTDVLGFRVLVISAMGNVGISPTLDSPFGHIDRLLARLEGQYDLAVLDIHAEATGEKLAVAYAYDGKINVVFGTHTHVPTADERILPNGTGYISDVGMCGESEGILGMDPESVVMRMRTKIPYSFKTANGPCKANGVIFDLDTSSRRVRDIKRIVF